MTDHVRVDPAPAEDKALPTAVRLNTAAAHERFEGLAVARVRAGDPDRER
ncbi:hypothetical protein ACH4VX_09915 [Streptomyces sp. NPDC020731]